MPVKVKRGLGLIVLAFVLWLVTVGISQVAAASAAAEAAQGIGVIVFGLAWIGCALAGLGLVIWGLLRD